MDHVDCIVIGAGVVGLAVARELQLRGQSVFVLERENTFGQGASSRNSEVIHAGIYYPEGSLKARLCVEGKQRLYAYAAKHEIPHARLGKLIVAVNTEDEDKLRGYFTRGHANGVEDLRWVDQAELGRLEPAVRGVSALYSPSTGIIDSHALMLRLGQDLAVAGGELIYRTAVTTIEHTDGLVVIGTADGYAIGARWVINAAGLHAPDLVSEPLRKTFATGGAFCKGHYYQLSGRSPFHHLVYPVAVAGGLGVHVTLDLAGQARFGPDVRWVQEEDYSFDDSQRSAFVIAIQRYYPGLDPARLAPAYTGIRPKIVGPGKPDADFLITCDRAGDSAIVHLLGIESPGLTASLAIADYVANFLEV